MDLLVLEAHVFLWPRDSYKPDNTNQLIRSHPLLPSGGLPGNPVARQSHLVPYACGLFAWIYKSPQQHVTTIKPTFSLLLVPNPCYPQESTYSQRLLSSRGIPFGQPSLIDMGWLK